jgi:hypothetical protein
MITPGGCGYPAWGHWSKLLAVWFPLNCGLKHTFCRPFLPLKWEKISAKRG